LQELMSGRAAGWSWCSTAETATEPSSSLQGYQASSVGGDTQRSRVRAVTQDQAVTLFATDESDDLPGGDVQILVFPKPTNCPSRQLKDPVSVPISVHIRIELPNPPFLVRFRNGAMNRTAVPEAAINEDCKSSSWKHNVSSSPEIGKRRSIHEVADSLSV
jgi:hypothetical protein